MVQVARRRAAAVLRDHRGLRHRGCEDGGLRRDARQADGLLGYPTFLPPTDRRDPSLRRSADSRGRSATCNPWTGSGGNCVARDRPGHRGSEHFPREPPPRNLVSAKEGVLGASIDPITSQRISATELLHRLLIHVRDSLDEGGEYASVESALQHKSVTGNGSDWQQRTLRQVCLRELIARAVQRTVPTAPTGTDTHDEPTTDQ